MMLRSLVIPIAAAATVGAPLAAKEAVIGLSPFGSPERKLEEAKAIALHLAEIVEPGETAYVVDAFTQDEIAAFSVPNEPDRYSRPKSKMRVNAAFFAEMKRFAEAARTPSGGHFAGQIDMPRFFRTVGANYPAGTARDLVLYGASPIFDDPRMPRLSMKTGATPDDASIAASRGDNAYGSAGEERVLANYAVHWGAPDGAFARNDRHLHFVQRFLALSVAARGGVLATFATEPDAALRNAAAGLSKPVVDDALKPDGEPTMIFYHEVEAALEETSVESIYERRLSERTPNLSEMRGAADVQIAIRWSCDCDFDLAVQTPGGAPISYRRLETPEGRLFKDFTSSDALNNGWETVAMTGPVDLTRLIVAVNLFRGDAGGEVELRVAIGRETWGWRFAFEGAGDGGRGFAETLARRAPANAAWTVADLSALLGGSQ